MDLKILMGTLLLITTLMGVKSIRHELTDIDLLRRELYKIGSTPKLNSWKKDEAFYDLIHMYKNFEESIRKKISPNIGNDFNVLSSVWLWANTKTKLFQIDGLYMNFRELQKDLFDKQKPLNNRQWTNFANTVLTDPNAAVNPALKSISDSIVHEKLFVLAYQEASSHICNTQQSPQQLLYNLYKTIAVTELKGFAMMQFSYALLKLYNLGNFTEEMEQLKQQYANRTSDTLRAVKTAMAFAPREVWKCDPSKHIEDKTYTQLKQVFQGYVVNEVDLNSQGTCKENCGYYSYSKVYGCFKNNYCAQQRTCNGKVLNCQYIDSDMWICPSDKSSSRRYEYIEYEDGKLFGQKGTCSRGTTKVDSWWRWLFWHCSYCMCYCDDHNVLSDRYFNLRDVTADVENNKVVTGVRMKKENQIIHIQIQQGVLLPRGNIDEKTIGWKPIENYTILDHNVRSGIDYHTIMWEKRAIDLDDLDAPEGHLLTGLRFRLVGSHLNLEIQMTPFNFSTGKLIQDKSQWHSNDNTDAGEVYDLNGETFLAKKRTELNINKPDIPTRSKVQSAPDSQSNQYLHFAPTDLEKDAAQTTIPFIDIQPIEPNPPAPISGAGIYHKGREGFGGFIGLKLFTFNIEPQLQADLPPNPPPVVNIGLSNEINEM